MLSQIVNIEPLQDLYDLFCSFPEDYSKLNMSDYAVEIWSVDNDEFDGGSFTPFQVSTVADCNTVMCALGHLPTIPKYPAKEGENWDEYSNRILGIRIGQSLADRNSGNIIWDFLFSGAWSDDLELLKIRLNCVIQGELFDDTATNLVQAKHSMGTTAQMKLAALNYNALLSSFVVG